MARKPVGPRIIAFLSSQEGFVHIGGIARGARVSTSSARKTLRELEQERRLETCPSSRMPGEFMGPGYRLRSSGPARRTPGTVPDQDRGQPGTRPGGGNPQSPSALAPRTRAAGPATSSPAKEKENMENTDTTPQVPAGLYNFGCTAEALQATAAWASRQTASAFTLVRDGSELACVAGPAQAAFPCEPPAESRRSIVLTAQALAAAADWAESGPGLAEVMLLADNGTIVAAQGDDRAAFDRGGRSCADRYFGIPPLDL